MVKVIYNQSEVIEGLESYSIDEICHIVLRHISTCIEEYEMSCCIIAIAIYGSRNRHTSTDISDLDVVVEYIGIEREDDCFNIFNLNPLYIEDIKVDINPITKFKSGDIVSFLEKCRRYDAIQLHR